MSVTAFNRMRREKAKARAQANAKELKAKKPDKKEAAKSKGDE